MPHSVLLGSFLSSASAFHLSCIVAIVIIRRGVDNTPSRPIATFIPNAFHRLSTHPNGLRVYALMLAGAPSLIAGATVCQ